MLDKFSEYLFPSEESLKSLWHECYIILDTNVLIEMYRYSESARDDIFGWLGSVKERLWLPHQVATEYFTSRPFAIELALNKHDELHKKVKSLKEARFTKDREIEVKEEWNKVLDEATQKLGALMNKVEAKQKAAFTECDDVLEKFKSLYEGRIGERFKKEELEKIFEEGRIRFEDGVPPGYTDKDKLGAGKYGDLIIWKEMIRWAKEKKRPIVFVTQERKEDWWWMRQKEGKGSLPYPLLRREMKEEAKSEFFMYSLDDFIEEVKVRLGKSVQDETVNEIKETQLERQRELQLVEANLAREMQLREVMKSSFETPMTAAEMMKSSFSTPMAVAEMMKSFASPITVSEMMKSFASPISVLEMMKSSFATPITVSEMMKSSFSTPMAVTDMMKSSFATHMSTAEMLKAQGNMSSRVVPRHTEDLLVFSADEKAHKSVMNDDESVSDAVAVDSDHVSVDDLDADSKC